MDLDPLLTNLDMLCSIIGGGGRIGWRQVEELSSLAGLDEVFLEFSDSLGDLFGSFI